MAFWWEGLKLKGHAKTVHLSLIARGVYFSFVIIAVTDLLCVTNTFGGTWICTVIEDNHNSLLLSAYLSRASLLLRPRGFVKRWLNDLARMCSWFSVHLARASNVLSDRGSGSLLSIRAFEKWYFARPAILMKCKENAPVFMVQSLEDDHQFITLCGILSGEHNPLSSINLVCRIFHPHTNSCQE